MIQLEPLGPAGLDAFFTLHDRSCFGGCYCAVWTAFGPDWSERCRTRTLNRRTVEQRVRAGQHVGYLVRDDETAVGWVGAGPRAGYPSLHTRAAVRRVHAAPTDWFVGCFAIAPEHRGEGIADAALARVVEHAEAGGARWIDATPVEPFDEPRAYRGSRSLYARHGFQEVAWEPDESHRVVLMRREV